jgi:DNA-binding winged helix-turn-helix (wHTH) protein
MPRPPSSSAILRFDVYALNLCAGELFKSGRKIKLQEQPFQILVMLLERPGEVVTREELRQKLWSEDTFVDFEHSLNTAIKKLRSALNDEVDKPRFIETLRRRGYRFSGSVTEELLRWPQKSAGRPAVTDLIGKVMAIHNEAGDGFVCVAINEETLEEKQMLNSAGDDLGLALLFAEERMLVVPSGTRVKVLQGRGPDSCYAVRILDGEHTAKIAIVPEKCLDEPVIGAKGTNARGE